MKKLLIIAVVLVVGTLTGCGKSETSISPETANVVEVEKMVEEEAVDKTLVEGVVVEVTKDYCLSGGASMSDVNLFIMLVIETTDGDRIVYGNRASIKDGVPFRDKDAASIILGDTVIVAKDGSSIELK